MDTNQMPAVQHGPSEVAHAIEHADANQPRRRPRAQGQAQIPWPAELDGQPETACVAVRVVVTEDVPGRDVDVLADLPRVDVGDPEATLRKLVAYRFEGAARETLLAEIDAIGTIDPACPLVLERLHEGHGGICVRLEALILPVSKQQGEDLTELLEGEPDAHMRHEIGMLFAEDVAELWREQTQDDRLPIRYLEDAIPAARTPAGSTHGAAPGAAIAEAVTAA
jgi:hypothetical protein